MANHAQRGSDPPRRRSSIEYRGLGQSGYTAGRREHDPSLERELETVNTSYPRGIDPDAVLAELGTDDRFVGRGGTAPREPEAGHDAAPPGGAPEAEPDGDVRDPGAPPADPGART